MTDRFGGRVKLVVENWGDSAIAARLGVTRYPCVFVGDAIFAAPQDMGFYGDAKSGKYTPWRDPASHARFRDDLVRMLELTLAGAAQDAAASSDAPPADATIAALPEVEAADLDGRPIATASLKGRPVLVEFWATWCPPCLKTLPFLAELKRKHGDRLEVLTFAVESEEKDVRDMAPKLAAGLPVAIGTPEIALAFGNLLVVPTLFLFDRDGKTAEVFYGAPEDLHERIERAIDELGPSPAGPR